MLNRILISYWNIKKELHPAEMIFINGYPVFLSKHIKTPISFGLLKANIYFPLESLSKWSIREIEMCLTHEIIHVKRYDSLWKIFSLILQATLFFIPWIYYLHKRLILEMEFLCDAETCNETKAGIDEYGTLLLSMTVQQSKNFILNNLIDITLKRRFLAMKKKSKKANYLIFLLCGSLGLTSVTMVALANEMITQDNMFKVTSTLIENGKIISQPTIIAKENQKALIILTNTNHIESQGIKIGLIAKNTTTEKWNNTIEIQYDIHQYNEKHDQFHVTPHIIVKPNKQARIYLTTDEAHSYEMIVTAERIKN